MSKYAALAEYLEKYQKDTIRLSFAEVEGVIGEPLPYSARHHDAWWANSRTNDTHLWAHLWIRAGWEKCGLNLNESWVEFKRVEFFDVESPKAREGYEMDRAILARARNKGLADKRKRIDDYTCQACDFRLSVGSRFVVEAHHLNPLSDTDEVETSIDDLVSLCPTCHRIAHLRSTPYDIDEIREILTSGD